MEIFIEVLKIVFLFLAVSYTFSCLATSLNRNSVNATRVNLMALGWTGFIYLQWLAG